MLQAKEAEELEGCTGLEALVINQIDNLKRSLCETSKGIEVTIIGGIGPVTK